MPHKSPAPRDPVDPPPQSILGDWRITWMEQWDQDFVDAEVEGYVRFDRGGTGEFQFGYVHGQIGYEPAERGGKPGVEWSWEGNDEMDPASGWGWAVLQEDGTLKGKLFFHQGDNSDFYGVEDRGSGQGGWQGVGGHPPDQAEAAQEILTR